MDGTFVSCGCCDDAPAKTEASLMSVADAVALALCDIAPVAGRELRPLGDALGRVTVDRIEEPGPLPRFDSSAMDGVALRTADLAQTSALPLAGTIAAGDGPSDLPAGRAMQIFTGAPMPRGADAVVMIERCRISDDHVHIDRPPAPGDNIRPLGSDQAPGQSLIEAGTRLTPHHIGLLAANGVTEVALRRKPRIAVFSTGDELTEGACAGGQINDANRPMLLALIRAAGAEAVDAGVIPDDLAASAKALDRVAPNVDLIVTSGAVSMGGKDHLRAALDAAGGAVRGWRVAIKPGKPVLFGRIGEAAYTGLPGNPFAVHVGFHLFVAPQIARLSGATPRAFATVPARAGFDWTRKPGRAEVFPARLLRYDETGLPVLERLGRSVSGTLLPLSGADGLAMVPAETCDLRSGDALHWQPFSQGDIQ